MADPLIPSQEAREAAAPFGGLIEALIRAGKLDDHEFIQAFARFEQAIRKDEAERCAKVAESFSRMLDKPDHADAPKLIAIRIRGGDHA